jgi:hypothetical protein
MRLRTRLNRALQRIPINGIGTYGGVAKRAADVKKGSGWLIVQGNAARTPIYSLRSPGGAGK